MSARNPPLPEHVHAPRIGGSRPSHRRLPADTLLPDRVNHADPPVAAATPLLSVARESDTPVQPEPVKGVSEKSVMFDLQPQEWEFTPDGEKAPELAREERGREHGHGHGHEHRERRRDDSPDSQASDETIELPPRFGERGRARDDDPLAAKLESVLVGLLR